MSDIFPVAAGLVWVLAILCVIYLSVHVVSFLSIKRHALDGLDDPRRLDAMRERVETNRGEL